MTLARLPAETRERIIAGAVREIAGRKPAWKRLARPEQLLPDGDWSTWLILAGRGWGKTRTGAEAVRVWKDAYPRIGIVAPTFADARDTCVEGESGLRAICSPSEIVKWNRSLGELEFRNGAQVKLFSSDEPDRLRGPQHYKLWGDELGAWKYPQDTWDMAMFGLRLGDRPQTVITTTPRPISVIRDLLKNQTTHVTRGTTYDNRANLAATFFDQIVTRYEGTRLGRQELNAEVLEDVPGALWKRSELDDHRVSEAPELIRVVTAIDPSATSGDTSDEAGIVTAGIGWCNCRGEPEQHGFVLADDSRRDTPQGWAGAAIDAYQRHQADRLIGEGNNGGEMVELVLRSVAKTKAVEIGYSMVWASRGKWTRAEPISALYEQGKVHHVGTHPQLEDEYCTWVQGEGRSPNRLDAAVWALTELFGGVSAADLIAW